MANNTDLLGLQLSDAERDAITGDPTKYFDPSGMMDRQDASAAAQRAAAGKLRSELYGSIDENALTADTTGIELTPEEEQRMVTSAGQSAGVGYRAGIGDLEQKARAAGVDPLGVQSARQRSERSAAIEGANAMTRARIAASQSRADRKMQSEDLRLGANRDIAGRKTNAATVAGNADLNAEGNINAQQRQQLQFNTTTGTGIENTAAIRAAELAKNRQAQGQKNIDTRFSQGQQVSNTLSDRSKTIGDAKLKTAEEARGYLTKQNEQANNNTQNEADRQGKLYSEQNNVRNSTTSQQLQQDAQPKLWEKIAGTAIGALGAATGAKKAGVFADGGVVTEPTFALIGEDGPEAVVPLSDRTNPNVRGGQLYGQLEQMRRPKPRLSMNYGQAA